MCFPPYVIRLVALLAYGVVANALFASQTEVTSNAVLQPGDHLRITVLSDDKNLSGEFEVAPDSTLKHPLYNQIKVAGVPVGMLRERIASFLRRYQREPQLEVEALFKVTVGGEVRSPAIYYLAPETTVADAIARAGGATDRGNLNKVSISRDGRKVALKLGETGSNRSIETIQSGDQVSVAPHRNVMTSITPILGLGASILSAILIISR